MLFLTVLLALISVSHQTALTVALEPQEQLCYYVLTSVPDTSVGFYFAVQLGGNFDINFSVNDPEGNSMIKGDKERQGDWTFNAAAVGEYEFCFANSMSTFAEKVVDFEIKLEDDFKAQLPETNNAQIQDEPVNGMIFAVSNIDEKLNDMLRSLQYYKTRNNRNQHTVKSTEVRIFWFSLLEIILMCAMALFQVSVVHFFFKGKRRGMV